MKFSLINRMKEYYLFGTILLLILTTSTAFSETADLADARQVCQNWLTAVVHHSSQWAGTDSPKIENYQEITSGDSVLAYYFEIEPAGYVIVPILKEMVPVKSYSTTDRLDFSEPDGYTSMIRELLRGRYDEYINVYGSLEASQPQTGDVLYGREQRADWDKYTQDEAVFKTLLPAQDKSVDDLGPLLSTYWHQSYPYNNVCPWGDGDRTLVGCVATAASQIMAYYQWPPEGTGSQMYYWPGDNSCDGSSTGMLLTADFSDPYDWANIPNSCNSGCTAEQINAVAELCYEVGVAFNMDYGVCGSGAYTSDAVFVYPNYFRYKDIIEEHQRSSYGLVYWSDIIREEIENARPCQYRIYSHSIVCDGWRQIDTYYQVHMNYGWGGSNNSWYTIDNLYCNWDGCSSSVEAIYTKIMPDLGVQFSADTTWGEIPFEVQFSGSSELEVDTWSWNFGDGSTSSEQNPVHVYDSSGRFDVSLEINSGGETRSYATTGYITALADTIKGVPAMGDPGVEIEVTISANNTLPIRQMKIPVQYGGDLNLQMTSFSVEGCRSEGFDQVKKVNSDPANKRAVFSLYNIYTSSPNMSAGSGPILKLYFTIDSNANPSQAAQIEFNDYSSHHLTFSATTGLEYVPQVKVSSVTLTYKCGDADYNNDLNILDISYLIAYLYQGGPTPTPLNAANVNGDGAVNILDVTYLIDFLYKHGQSLTCE